MASLVPGFLFRTPGLNRNFPPIPNTTTPKDHAKIITRVPDPDRHSRASCAANPHTHRNCYDSVSLYKNPGIHTNVHCHSSNIQKAHTWFAGVQSMEYVKYTRYINQSKTGPLPSKTGWSRPVRLPNLVTSVDSTKDDSQKPQIPDDKTHSSFEVIQKSQSDLVGISKGETKKQIKPEQAKCKSTKQAMPTVHTDHTVTGIRSHNRSRLSPLKSRTSRNEPPRSQTSSRLQKSTERDKDVKSKDEPKYANFVHEKCQEEDQKPTYVKPVEAADEMDKMRKIHDSSSSTVLSVHEHVERPESGMSTSSKVQEDQKPTDVKQEAATDETDKTSREHDSRPSTVLSIHGHVERPESGKSISSKDKDVETQLSINEVEEKKSKSSNKAERLVSIRSNDNQQISRARRDSVDKDTDKGGGKGEHRARRDSGGEDSPRERNKEIHQARRDSVEREGNNEIHQARRDSIEREGNKEIHQARRDSVEREGNKEIHQAQRDSVERERNKEIHQARRDSEEAEDGNGETFFSSSTVLGVHEHVERPESGMSTSSKVQEDQKPTDVKQEAATDEMDKTSREHDSHPSTVLSIHGHVERPESGKSISSKDKDVETQLSINEVEEKKSKSSNKAERLVSIRSNDNQQISRARRDSVDKDTDKGGGKGEHRAHRDSGGEDSPRERNKEIHQARRDSVEREGNNEIHQARRDSIEREGNKEIHQARRDSIEREGNKEIHQARRDSVEREGNKEIHQAQRDSVERERNKEIHQAQRDSVERERNKEIHQARRDSEEAEDGNGETFFSSSTALGVHEHVERPESGMSTSSKVQEDQKPTDVKQEAATDEMDKTSQEHDSHPSTVLSIHGHVERPESGKSISSKDKDVETQLSINEVEEKKSKSSNKAERLVSIRSNDNQQISRARRESVDKDTDKGTGKTEHRACRDSGGEDSPREGNKEIHQAQRDSIEREGNNEIHQARRDSIEREINKEIHQARRDSVEREGNKEIHQAQRDSVEREGNKEIHQARTDSIERERNKEIHQAQRDSEEAEDGNGETFFKKDSRDI